MIQLGEDPPNGNLSYDHLYITDPPINIHLWCFGRLVYSLQGCQYRTGGRTGLATGTIYFGYRSIPVYHFGFTAIFYIYIYIYMYVCMYVSVYIYIIINIKAYHKTFPQVRTNYSWF